MKEGKAGNKQAYQIAQDDLYHVCDLSNLAFTTTDELEEITEHIGQSRAMEALKFGVDIKHEGYNLFVLGSTGLGKHTTVKELLEEESKQAEAPFDWCYVNNFEHPHKPLVLKLPKGVGRKLQQDMQQFVFDILAAIPAAFESDEYNTAFQALHDEYVRREDQALEEIAAKAERNNIIMVRTSTGWNLGPKNKDGKAMHPEEFEQLPEEEKQVITRVVEEMQDDLKQLLLKIPVWQKETRDKVKELNREITQLTVTHYADDLQANYTEEEVKAFLKSAKQDIIDNVELFRKFGAEKKSSGQTSNKLPPEFTGYQVNVLVDNSKTEGAPVIFEDNPTYQNLIGRIEHIAQFGTLLTDFSLIKPGALHLANGGYLVLDARKVLTSLYAWDGLKRILRSREIKIESLEQVLSLASTTSLQPEPIPVDVKVVLTGSRLLYYLLKQYDPEFDLLFKVAVDFAEDMDRDDASMELYARMIAALQKQNDLLPLDKGAVERIIEQASRMAQDSEKVSLHMGHLADLLKESDYWAKESDRESITREDVQKVIDTRLYRMDQIRERVQEAILRGTYLVNTSGETVAQVNGLSVIQLDDYAFGRPSRITATARLGSGKVIDIEREVELGGAIHSKGVMILSSYLAYRYAKERPLALSASLAFEQSYGMIEGDSASAAELCALLSALGDVPLKQSLAVTGSVNQHGEIQAIGGVNEKIEGFFDICEARGLTGDQGVIIPASNVKHLMLKASVVEAVESGKFAVYGVTSIDEVMALLTGLEIGEADENGDYPKESLNWRIEQQIRKLTELREKFAESKKPANEKEKKAGKSRKPKSPKTDKSKD
ncbi:ATP-binding protein [Thiomicrorhabdus sp. ZW0627]|uniref:Lon protease family protein n=1 Tax=Thiomicrorhabdus sp. ZW0627 TaxID=3039774 RepID=UPI0024364FD7|nr:ATP-binding protein [Thiomicrorhabdus sp. ZW0627]MDG6772788.1 ATP-binding protein [Thiomicrorhabdus sp. ZW0627]